MPVSQAAAQGLRLDQEDRFVIAQIKPPNYPRASGQLLAIMDGHGGSSAAQIVTDNLASALLHSIQMRGGEIELALRDTFDAMAKKTKQEIAGTTLSLVFLPLEQKRAYVGVLGDSPVAVIDTQGVLRVGACHNAFTNLQERQRAISNGALFSNGYLEDPRVRGEGIQLTRALGDSRIARILNREPEFMNVLLGPESCVFLSSDGILDPRGAEYKIQMRKIATQAQSGWDAQRFVNDALSRQTGDNVTVIVWR